MIRLPKGSLPSLVTVTGLLATLVLLAQTVLAAGAAVDAVNAGAAGATAAQVQERLPHDPQAFTQGLLFHQGSLLESTGLYGQSSLRRVDPQTGTVLASTRLPRTIFAEGLALCPAQPGHRARLVLLTWREGRILTFDAKTLRQTGSHHLKGQGWGLAWDGARLLLSDGSDTLRLLTPDTFAETGQLKVRDGTQPVRDLNELEWVEGWLLANVWGRDRIAIIHPPDTKNAGQVAAWLDVSALRQELGPQAETANGIAYNPHTRTLFVTGKRWDKTFTLALPPLLNQPPR
ncbi:MAG: glutaminyl-peptide cyclotransferase [Humidesulfovibrio sp.]|nr:glutaminyl-peptide cyclotransferase [Humidesulfovibrio sp.]